jgi:preprotein translocase subunit SecG
MLYTLLHVVQVLSALALIGIILIQQGKGASMGAAFGAGASATVFGARGAGSVLTRMTTILAIVFFSVSFYMSVLSAGRVETRSIIDQIDPSSLKPAEQELPPTPGAPAANGAPAMPEVPAAPAAASPSAAPAMPTAPAASPVPAAPAPAAAEVPAVPAPDAPASAP